MSYLENTGDGLDRYPNQQVLYQWKKFVQLPSLPHGAYVGQIDAFSNGDCWVIMKAGAALPRGKFFKPPAVITLAQDLAKAYKKGAVRLYLQNDAATAIVKDSFVGASIGVRSGTGEPNGLTNRITSNSAAAAASGTTYPEFWVELQYPWEDAVGVDARIKITPHKHSGVLPMNAATDNASVGLPPINVTSGYYFWGKVGGDHLVQIAGAVAIR